MVLHTILVLWPFVKWPIKVQATTHVAHSICSGLCVLSLLLAVHHQTSKWSVLTTWCFRAPLGYDPHKFCASFFSFFNSAEEIPPTSGALYRLRMVCQLPRLCSHPLPFVSGDSSSSERQSGHPAQPASPVGQRAPGCCRPSWQLLWNKTPLIPKCVQFSQQTAVLLRPQTFCMQASQKQTRTIFIIFTIRKVRKKFLFPCYPNDFAQAFRQ